MGRVVYWRSRRALALVITCACRGNRGRSDGVLPRAAATGAPRLARATVAGPEVHDLRSLSRLWGGDRPQAIEIPIPLPGKLGRALREGRLTCANPDVRGTHTFAAWLLTNPH